MLLPLRFARPPKLLELPVSLLLLLYACIIRPMELPMQRLIVVLLRQRPRRPQ